MTLSVRYGRDRFLAATVDAFLTGFASFFGLYLGAFWGAFVMALRDAPPSALESAVQSGMSIGFFFWGISFHIVNQGMIQGLTGASIGKFLFRLEVVKSSNEAIDLITALKRCLLIFPSVAMMGVGFFSLFFHASSLAWHDQWAKTKVLSLRKIARVDAIKEPTVDFDIQKAA